jgi:uncharacterized protein YndB with AHSA1/START domain
MTVDKIERAMDFPFPPERVWRAVTRPQELSKWFGDRVYMDPEIGSEIVIEWDEYGQVSGVVEAFEPPRRFAFRWRAHGIDPGVPLASDNSTLVTFTVEPTIDGARLNVVETGFSGLPAALRATAYRENERGWEVELSELVDYLDNVQVEREEDG